MNLKKWLSISLCAVLFIPVTSLANSEYYVSDVKSVNVNLWPTLFVGENTSNEYIKALRPLVNEIFSVYDVPMTNLNKARVLRDFVARVAIHPFNPFHLNTKANLSMLPENLNWDEFNQILFKNAAADSYFWSNRYPNGFEMLKELFGTINMDTLLRNDDGMLVKINPGQYRIKNYDLYHGVLCTWQDNIYIALLAAAGLHGMQLRTFGHDPAAVFIPELGKWVYEDPTFNEEYTVDDNKIPVSPSELQYFARLGQYSRLSAKKNIKPRWDQYIYIDPKNSLECTYFERMSRLGALDKSFTIVGAEMNNRVIDEREWNWHSRMVVVNVEGWDKSPFAHYEPVSNLDAFPELGVKLAKVMQVDNMFKVTLMSSFPNHVQFWKRINNGGWQKCDSTDTLTMKKQNVTYRSTDAEGFYGIDAIIKIEKIDSSK